MSKKFIIIHIIILVVLVSIIGGVYYLSYKKGYATGYAVGDRQGRAAAQVNTENIVGNPLENMPSANPFEKVVNPFKELYKNPFK